MTPTTIVGGAMLPHAPQFFTLPETEDKATVQSVRDVAARIAAGLKALEPDLWIMIANDHAQQFFHQCAPPFTLHVGGEARGRFSGPDFRYSVPSAISFELVRRLYRAGFDPAFTSSAEIDYALGIPLTHLGIESHVPVLPIYVNAYLPPQPTMERCYAFGHALANAVTAMGLRTAVIASGGMSHFPGTDRYSAPELEWDKRVLEKLREGKLKSLIGYDEQELDDTGNIELRCWAIAAGALGERVPDVCQMDPSWHHNYASLGWYGAPPADARPHYPQLQPDLVEVVSALHALAHDPAARSDFLRDAAGYADRYRLTPAQREALITLDMPAFAAMGAHPLVPFLAHMQIERLRKEQAR
jgi:2,3-dihydroxyphenylpropionate 1,2-dioxygenase